MTDNRGMDVSDDVDPTDGRDESLNERMDRNWNEILQELRVTQTGTQIFTGFLAHHRLSDKVQRTDHLPGSGLSRARDRCCADYRTRIGAGKPAPQLVPQGRKDDHRADRTHHHADHAGRQSRSC